MIRATSRHGRPVGDEVAVDAPEEAHLAGAVAGEPAGRLALLVLAAGDERRRGRRDGSHVPFEPSVHTRWWTTQPAAAHLASVPPAPNSTSSGWAPTASADDGAGRSRVQRRDAASAAVVQARSQPRREVGAQRRVGEVVRGCRRRAPAAGRGAPRRGTPAAIAAARWRLERPAAVGGRELDARPAGRARSCRRAGRRARA